MPVTNVTITGSVFRPGWKDRMMNSIQRSVRDELTVIQRDMERRSPRDSGGYAGSFIQHVSRTGLNGTSVRGFIENLRQPEILQHVIETGRIPGSRMPPYLPIFQWVQRHFNGTPRTLERITWAVRFKIHRDGTRPHYIFRNAEDLAVRRFGPFKIRLRNQLLRDLR